MLDYKPNAVLSTTEYKVVGTRPPRHDALDKVTGNARYGADVRLPGMLYGAVLRSPHAHARIKSIDASRARALPGVKAVIVSSDLPDLSGKVADLGEGARANYTFMSQNILAGPKVLYKGHAVAAVAATSPFLAEEALALIKVEYDVLPAVLDGREAMKDGAPVLHEGRNALAGPGARPGASPTNIASRVEFKLGDLEEGFKKADVIVERETHTKAVHQGYIEPHAATAQWHADGNVTVWSSSQGQFMVREQTSTILGIPVSRVKAVPMEIGGGFGGKLVVYLEPLAALLSRESGGQPVKLTMSRTEVFEATGPTSGTHVRVKLGATKEGKLVAGEAHLIYEAGAYPGSPVGAGCRCIFAPYDIPNAYIEGYDVVVNIPRSVAYRAPGSPAAALAMETAIDELCERLGMDPLEFRILNSAREGVRQATGPVHGKLGHIEVLQAAKSHDHYAGKLAGPYRGRGVASGFWFNASGPSSAIASVNPDGTVSLAEGSPDIGGTRTSVAMQLAEALGIPVSKVKPSVVDTDSIGFTSVTGGSGVTFKTGVACYEAGLDIKRQMIERAAAIWNVAVENVEYKEGALFHTSDPNLKLTFAELAARLNATGGPIVGRATVNPRGVGAAVSTHLVDVEVDPDTGKVTVLRYTAVQDAGKAVHPTYVEGQIQGGVAQGVGWALNEEYFYNDQGRMMNASFLDYRMPTSLDLPMIDTVIVEVANPGHPFGVRGVGEVPICPPLAAMNNAVYHAIGVRIDELPMTPARVLAALRSNGHKNGHKG
ncbi:MAG: xanthine dehydrogenase family protein molybdopterin-binding subunit [Chloroflexi bacterium]|nr:xanthine dehydrogenase family protein molybdopterin-binding subunit [Chloroflexota bacterium]